MAKHVTTNLRFPEATYRELQYQARRQRVPLALLVREAVAHYLGRAEGGGAIAFGDDPTDALVGSVGASAGDKSVNHDHYLYGWPKGVDDESAGGHERAGSGWHP